MDLLILNVGIFCIILSVPHNTIMKLNNVMQLLVNKLFLIMTTIIRVVCNHVQPHKIDIKMTSLYKR